MDTPPGDNALVHERLGKLTTIWLTLASVHEGSTTSDVADRLQFIQRFQRAAYRFLLGRLQNADAADELFQEGVLRFVRGDAREMGPQEVGLREYLRITLSELLSDQQATASRVGPAREQPVPPPGNEAAGGEAGQFVDCWRDELLDQAWEELERGERQGSPPYYSALRYHADHPEQSSAEIALEITLAKQLSTALSGHDFRDLLQRARQQYADHLLNAAASSLSAPSTQDLERELTKLDLLRFCRGALQRRGIERL